MFPINHFYLIFIRFKVIIFYLEGLAIVPIAPHAPTPLNTMLLITENSIND